MYRSHVLVCGGTGCTSSGSPKIMEALHNEIKKQGLEEEVAVVETGCHGLCALGPIMIVYPDATFYSMVQPNDIPEIVSEHLLKGRVVTRLLYQETVSPTGGIKALRDTDFYKKQHRIALRNCGVINPENIEEYIGTGGYQALGKVLTEMTPDDVIPVSYTHLVTCFHLYSLSAASLILLNPSMTTALGAAKLNLMNPLPSFSPKVVPSFNSTLASLNMKSFNSFCVLKPRPRQSIQIMKVASGLTAWILGMLLLMYATAWFFVSFKYATHWSA